MQATSVVPAHAASETHQWRDVPVYDEHPHVYAQCDCGWRGPNRFLFDLVCLDGEEHCSVSRSPAERS